MESTGNMYSSPKDAAARAGELGLLAGGGVARKQPTISDCAEQMNDINSGLAGALDRARNLVDRIGGNFPPSSPEAAISDGSGPVDYIHSAQRSTLTRVSELMDLLNAIGNRI